MANVVDPREHEEDLIVEREEHPLNANAFRRHRDSEAFRSGWVVGALTLDVRGRVLLIHHPDDGWLTPGGTVQPGEFLREAVVREVHEETGVRVAPDRPQALVESTIRHGPERATLRFVLFTARPRTLETAKRLGMDDEPIQAASWFDELPEPLYYADLTRRVVTRCRNGDGAIG
ncbi:MAG: NUDIX domain-containing protein [Candidatus Bipolaricaulia bacterium]